jgi:hypothetical protein
VFRLNPIPGLGDFIRSNFGEVEAKMFGKQRMQREAVWELHRGCFVAAHYRCVSVHDVDPTPRYWGTQHVDVGKR